MNNEIVLYKSDDGKLNFDVKLDEDTVWLTQAQIAKLFDKAIPTINEHIKNIFREKELIEKSVIRNFRITAADGKAYGAYHYNLDVIISVGYRVKSKRGTQFRIWATKVLRNHLLNGYSINRRKLEAIESKIDVLLTK
ncbi:virulence RhuM family protein, partial [Candidatus Margulisiibacteriota bacterium]